MASCGKYGRSKGNRNARPCASSPRTRQACGSAAGGHCQANCGKDRLSRDVVGKLAIEGSVLNFLVKASLEDVAKHVKDKSEKVFVYLALVLRRVA